MNKLDRLKSSIKRNKIILSICLVLIVICVSCLTYSYAIKKQDNDLPEVKEDNKFNEVRISSDREIQLLIDGAYYDIVASMDVFKIEPPKEDVVPKVTVAKADNKEDPQKLNKANKGVAKKEDVKQATEKYETNETSFGIDVSSYQGVIDWKKVKESGVSFAMIRVGFRGYGSGEIFEDRYFRRNVQGAIANNINVGIYFFSAAKDSAEAREEAVWIADTIKNYDISFPVAIDIEIFDEYRLEGVSNAQMTENALVFCRYMESKGYTPMIYSYLKAFNNRFETPKFGNYRIWLAQYNDVATYKGKYYMWQYTSDGSVPGITGRVDMNVAYFSVTNDITKKSEVTGTDGSSSLEEVSFYDADQEVTINKNKELRATPYTNAPNRVGAIETGTKVILKGVSDQFIKIEHDGNILYIDDPSCYDLPDVEFSELSGTYKTTKRVKVFNIPYDIYNSSTLIDADTVIEVLGKSDKFTKIKQGDKIYYVREFDFYTELTNEPVVVEPEEPVIPSEPVTPSEPETPSIEEPPVEEENTNN